VHFVFYHRHFIGNFITEWILLFRFVLSPESLFVDRLANRVFPSPLLSVSASRLKIRTNTRLLHNFMRLYSSLKKWFHVASYSMTLCTKLSPVHSVYSTSTSLAFFQTHDSQTIFANPISAVTKHPFFRIFFVLNHIY
jgi:hypothetical protein